MATVDKRIAAIVKDATTGKSYRYVAIGTVSAELARMVRTACRRDVSGYTLILDTNHIRHVLKRHPNVTMRDFLLLPTILKSPDDVKKGNKSDAIVLHKDIAFEYTCVEIIIDSERKLRLKTFWFGKKRGKNSNGGSEKSEPPRKA